MNGILVIDKEKNKTSREVVNEVCKKIGTKHVGHTGTLDPIATGVLVLGVNDGCKIIDLLTSSRKTYVAEVVVGIETDTLDVTGNIINTCDVDDLDISTVENVIDNFPKKYMQEVPKYSAIHVDGKRLYDYARNNIEVELPKREVEIYDLKLVGELKKDRYYSFCIEADVSKGTYIRSLIRDIGNSLNIPCTMKELRRVKQGVFTIDQATKIEDINPDFKLISILDALSDYEKIIVDDETAKKVLNGMVLKLDTNNNLVLVVDKNNNLLAIYERYKKDNTLMKPYRVFKEEK